MRVRWSARSRRDLANVETYFSEVNPAAGERLVARVLAAGSQLALFPRRGRALPDGARQIVVAGRYILVYRVSADTVRILRVWHAAQERPR